MAPDQYLLERFHVEGLLLPHLLQNPALGANGSLIFATSFVFFLTWFFHAYQWFWLRGIIPFYRARYVILVYSGMPGGGQYTL